MTITLTINDIPNYLKDSELYKNIESDDSFKVPEQYFKKELVINTFNDFVLYLAIFDYWMLGKYPNEIYIFIINNKDKINIDLLKEQFPMNEFINKIKTIIETPDDEICEYFSSVGNLDCLKYCHENGCPWYEDTCSSAAKNGHFECLKYAHENDCSWCEETCSSAVSNGHLKCLKYAHENDCELLADNLCSIAALNGHLECLKYAYENGCEWIWSRRSFTKENKDLEWCEFTFSSAASSQGHL